MIGSIWVFLDQEVAEDVDTHPQLNPISQRNMAGIFRPICLQAMVRETSSS
ncbi:hypothetical protein FE257_008744 [Aspergillus nanangensis]|uniref:Uncharacterized protein n=1 Tax=Aspergillus nanangensis TaxID=2582783 RepID=A0AAD4GT41_ASPNN|nr:hypothetical protein FE257_008744 [Aspergillus nanangensis]